jgi:cytoskeletal protein CcmA (bactofilin family)
MGLFKTPKSGAPRDTEAEKASAAPEPSNEETESGRERPTPFGARSAGAFHPDVPRPKPATKEEKKRESSRSSDKGNTLIVGANIELKGEISACETLVVEGRIQASMDSRHIEVAQNGVFNGEAGVDTADIAGVFEGNLTVRERLTVRSTGRISGTIRYGRLQVEEGGIVQGEISALEQPTVAHRPPRHVPSATEPEAATETKGEPAVPETEPAPHTPKAGAETQVAQVS